MYRSDKSIGKYKYNTRGIAVLFQNEISRGISKCDSKNSDCIWVKCDKSAFGYVTDTYICFIYIPPINLTTNEEASEIFETLENEIGHYSQKGNVILLGDLNARTGLVEEIYTLTDNFYENTKIDSRSN